MKMIGKLFLIVFWTIIWGTLLVPLLIVGALFYIFGLVFRVLDLVFWRLECMSQHCEDAVKRLAGECRWLDAEDMEDDEDGN